MGEDFAWRYWTNVSNWAFDSDIESIALNGPFAPGSRGVTMSRSSGRIEWVLSDVQAGKSAVIEISVAGTVARFQWLFEDLGGATRITQRVSIEGENAQALGQMLQPGIAAMMQKLCENMVKAASV